MMRNDKRTVCKSIFLCALLLAAVPKASGNAQAGEISVSSGTTAGELSGSPDFSGSGLKVTIVGKDGSARTGAVQGGDTVVVKDASGNVVGSYQISLSGSGGSSGQNPGSSSDRNSGSGASSTGGSSSPGGSSGAGTGAGSQAKAPAPSSLQQGGFYLFPQPVTVEDLRRQLSAQSGNSSLHVVVAAPSGTERSSGSVCTGDTVAVDEASGERVSSVTAVVLGDLTRCGRPASGGSSLLYDCLTGKRSLPADLAKAADLNRSGGIDTADLLLMKKRVSGIS